MKTGYYKRHYTAFIKKFVFLFLSGHKSAEELFDHERTTDKTEESIEVTEEDLNDALPNDSLTLIDNETYKLDFWRYEIESEEDGQSKVEVIPNGNFKTALDMSSDKIIYFMQDMNKYPRFTRDEIVRKLYNIYNYHDECDGVIPDIEPLVYLGDDGAYILSEDGEKAVANIYEANHIIADKVDDMNSGKMLEPSVVDAYLSFMDRYIERIVEFWRTRAKGEEVTVLLN